MVSVSSIVLILFVIVLTVDINVGRNKFNTVVMLDWLVVSKTKKRWRYCALWQEIQLDKYHIISNKDENMSMLYKVTLSIILHRFIIPLFNISKRYKLKFAVHFEYYSSIRFNFHQDLGIILQFEGFCTCKDHKLDDSINHLIKRYESYVHVMRWQNRWNWFILHKKEAIITVFEVIGIDWKNEILL